MANFKNYSILNDITAQKLNAAKLQRDLNNSSLILNTVQSIRGNPGSDVFTITLMIEITTEIESEIDSIVYSHDGEPIPDILVVDFSDKSDIQKATPVISLKPENDSFARATHDFCDKTTWYTKAIRVVGEVLSNPVDLTYSLANQFVIDVVNKKVNRQDTLQDYRVIVYDSGSEITNYTIDHASGTITLASAPSGQLTVDYSYATSSEWILEPEPGYMLIIEHSEIQFALDVSIVKPLRFEIWVYNPLFDPGSSVVSEDPTWYPLKSGEPVRNQLRFQYQGVQYNGIRDFVNEANLGTGTIPAIDDLPECVVFPFNYASIKPFKSSQGSQLRISSVESAEVSGSFGTATFYLIKRTDS